MFHWPYYDLIDGELWEDIGGGRRTNLVRAHKTAPKFEDSAEAEKWLNDNDFRGNVR